MYNLTGIELSRQSREEIAREVENHRLARGLRAARSGMVAGNGSALLARVFARFPRKGQIAEC